MSMEELMQQADPELYSRETTDVKPVDDARKEGGIIYAAGIEKLEVRQTKMGKKGHPL